MMMAAFSITQGGRRISDSFCRMMKLERKKTVVAMPPRNTQGWPGNLHAGSEHVAGIDGVAKRYIGVALCTHIAYCREPCRQGKARVLCANQRRPRDRDT